MTNRMFTWVSSITVVGVLLTGCSQATPTSTNSPQQNQESQFQAFTPQEVEHAKKMTAEYFARFEKGKITTVAELEKDILLNFRRYIKERFPDPREFLGYTHEHIIQVKIKPGQPEHIKTTSQIDFIAFGPNGDKYWTFEGTLPKLDKFEVFEFPDATDPTKNTLEVWSADGEYWTEIVKGESGLLFYTTSILTEQFKPLKRHNSRKKVHPIKGEGY